ELDGIVIRGLDRDREVRWDSADAMLRALGDWLASHAPSTGQESLADFMASIFGDDIRDEEVSRRDELLRRVEHDPASSRTSTVIYGREVTDRVYDVSESANDAPVPHVEK